MRVNDATLCRRCLLVYTAVVVAISAAYLFSNWGVHKDYITVREELLARQNGEGDLEGLAFTESGGAEYLLVLLYFFLHAVTFVLLLCGRQRNIIMGVACAALLASSMLYILFYGCLLLQARMEYYNSLPAPGDVPLRKPDTTAPYKLTAQDVDRTIASGSAGAEAVVDKTPIGRLQHPDEGTCSGNSGDIGMHTGEALTYSDLGWTVLETLVDVLAAVVNGPETPEGVHPEAQRYHPDGVPLAPTPTFAAVRRTSLLWMSAVGLVLSLWGVNTFDMSPQGVARAANPGLTASALSQLSSASSASQASNSTTVLAAAERNRRTEKSKEERRHERVTAALQGASLLPAAAAEAKKNQ